MKKIIETRYKWMPVEKTVYVAVDGREFDTELECLEYENKIEIITNWVDECKKKE